MARTWKMLPAALVAATLLLAAACGGNSDSTPEPQPSDQPQPTPEAAAHGAEGGQTSGALVSDIAQAMRQSVRNMQEQVNSVWADFTFDMSAGAMTVGANGEFRYQAPDQMYLKMKMNGGANASFDLADLGDIEVLVLGDTLYMNSAFTGWVKLSLTEMGADADTFKGWMAGHSPFDYAALVEKVGGNIESLGAEQIDGKTYAHFRVTIDLADILGAFAKALSSTGGTVMESAFPQGLSGPIVMDIWVDQATLLPYRLAANGDFTLGQQSAAMTLEFNFRQFNGAVDMPQAPASAQSLTELFSGMAGQGGGQ